MSATLNRALLGLQLLIWAVLLGGCASAPATLPADWDAALPEVAAQYRTRIVQKGVAGSRQSQWRMWRTQSRVERENLDDRSGESWQRDGDQLFVRKLYHAERRGVEFVKEDLRMADVEPNWARESMIVDPALLARLPLRRSGMRNGHPFQRHAGVLDGVRWDITWRSDLMLPTQVVRATGTRIERVDLLRAEPLAAAPWQPTSSDGYDILDYADLGDHEHDPFVMRLQHADFEHTH